MKMALIMAGGLEKDKSLPLHVKGRIDLMVHNHTLRKYDLILASSSFTLNKPLVTDGYGYPISESSTIARALEEYISTSSIILAENLSHDTVGSIFFSYLFFAEPRDILEIDFYTSDFHMDRVEVISNVINSKFFNNKFKLKFFRSRSEYSKGRKFRENHEKNAIKSFLSSVKNINSKKEFINFLFEHHRNYNKHYSGRILSNDELY